MDFLREEEFCFGLELFALFFYVFFSTKERREVSEEFDHYLVHLFGGQCTGGRGGGGGGGKVVIYATEGLVRLCSGYGTNFVSLCADARKTMVFCIYAPLLVSSRLGQFSFNIHSLLQDFLSR